MSYFKFDGKQYYIAYLLGEKSPLSFDKKQQIKEASKFKYSIVMDGEKKIVYIHGVPVKQSELEEKQSIHGHWMEFFLCIIVIIGIVCVLKSHVFINK